MATFEKIKLKPSKSNSEKNSESCFLIIYNDDVNTFEHVIESLVEICNHTVEQAEQCALITHFKGKCDVKKGNKVDLTPLRELLVIRGISAEISE